MNIVYHHRTRGAGAEGRHIKAIVDALRAQGHVVSVLSFPGADPEKEVKIEPATAGVSKQWYLKLLQWLAGLTKNAPIFVFELFEMLYNLMIPKRLNKEIDAVKPAFIYERYSLFMFAGVWVANKKSIPIILEVNDSALVSRIRPLVFKYWAKKVEQWVFTHCTGIVFVSTYLRDLAESEFGTLSKSVICPNAGDVTTFDLKQYDKEAIKKELGLAGKTICGYTGGFGAWHGIVWFVTKIIPMIKQHPAFGLLLVGDGASFNEVREVINNAGMEKQIVLTGLVKHDAVPKYLAAMDFGILPDLNAYCSPMKLFESMAMEQGMVLPASDPVKEVVVDGVTSWLFPVDDQQACIDKVMAVFNDPGQRIKVGKQARGYIERERQWSDNVALLLTLLT
ncbi:MAG: glycosyltransferase [Methylococcaceae bacterium]|nr:glycosyltransferase [Methylococcaceae bacterium]